MTALMMILGIVVFAVGAAVLDRLARAGAPVHGQALRHPGPAVHGRLRPDDLVSRKKGDTEYGFKAIPLGGYIRMIGMFPPGEDGRIRPAPPRPGAA